MKVQTVGTVSEFLRGKKTESFNVMAERHFRKYGNVYKVAGMTAVMLASGGNVLAASGIEVGAERLYDKLLSGGKWIIIFKGGFDTIKNMAGGDFDGAKKGFLSYLLVYIFLLGLPWAMDEIDVMFKDLKANA